jgi:hypothetical protein
MLDSLRGLYRSLVHTGTASLDRASILTEAAQGILSLGTFGERGAHVFPSGVTVRVAVTESKVDGIRRIVENPSFDRELIADLRNRLVAFEEFPARRYVEVAGAADGVEGLGDPKTVVFVLVVEGGDRDGARFPVENVRATWRMGRGPTHDDHGGLPNDFVLTETARFVSRAAAVLRYDAGLHLDVKEQGAALVIHRAGGGQERPYHTPRGSCPLLVGDVVEFNDGRQAQVRVRCLTGDAS